MSDTCTGAENLICMLEVHLAHVAIKARFATHPAFSKGKLHEPDPPELGIALNA